MPDRFAILVADRNRHVREFLRRELMAERFIVEVAGDGREVLTMLDRNTPLDLLIVDPEIPFVSGLTLLEGIRNSIPSLPVVIHSLLTEYSAHPALRSAAAFVEKKGNIDCLKSVVMDVLRAYYPERFASMQGA